MSSPDLETGPAGVATDERDDVLTIEHLSGGFRTASGDHVDVLRDVSMSVRRGCMTAIVGETGSGKTLTALSILGLAPAGFRRTSGTIRFDGDELGEEEGELRKLRGRKIAMVFQNSRSALNPVFTIGTQLRDVFRLHHGLGRKEAQARSVDLLTRVRVNEPDQRLGQYPHQLSGGTAQRVQLALALACQPTLLILDEPTTGLDVTIQADILELIVELNRDLGMSSCIITHDLGVVAETCTDVVVMRAGEVREIGSCEQIISRPADSYTKELLAASRVDPAVAR